MMKDILFRRSILLILFVIANLYFAVFNWKIFTVSLNINLGFGTVSFPPFLVLFLVGFIIIGILSWSNYAMHLQKKIFELEQGVAMGKMKDKLLQNRVQDSLFDEKNLEQLKSKMGISDIEEKYDELLRLMNELKENQRPGTEA